MSDEWPRAYGRALHLDSAPVEALTDAEAELVLHLARIVAHGRERRFAPLAAYLAGKYAAGRAAAGVSPERALREAMATAEALLSGGAEPTGGDGSAVA